LAGHQGRQGPLPRHEQGQRGWQRHLGQQRRQEQQGPFHQHGRQEWQGRQGPLWQQGWQGLDTTQKGSKGLDTSKGGKGLDTTQKVISAAAEGHHGLASVDAKGGNISKGKGRPGDGSCKGKGGLPAMADGQGSKGAGKVVTSGCLKGGREANKGSHGDGGGKGSHGDGPGKGTGKGGCGMAAGCQGSGPGAKGPVVNIVGGEHGGEASQGKHGHGKGSKGILNVGRGKGPGSGNVGMADMTGALGGEGGHEGQVMGPYTPAGKLMVEPLVTPLKRAREEGESVLGPHFCIVQSTSAYQCLEPAG